MFILSDLSEVLISGMVGIDEILSKWYGRRACEIFWQRHQALEPEFLDLMRGKMTEHDYWRKLAGGDAPFSAWGLQGALYENMKRKIPGTWDVYQRIISHPFLLNQPTKRMLCPPEIYIVSDHIAECTGWLTRHQHHEIFSTVAGAFWSCEMGKVKRDEGFFEDLLRRLMMRPDEAIFIDDLPANVEAARRTGITSILFTDAEALEQELTGYGFQFRPKAR